MRMLARVLCVLCVVSILGCGDSGASKGNPQPKVDKGGSTNTTAPALPKSAE